jgi:hypothetical protein
LSRAPGNSLGLPFSYRFFHNTQIAQSCADAPIAMIALSIICFIVSLIAEPTDHTVDRALGDGSFRVDDATVEWGPITDR